MTTLTPARVAPLHPVRRACIEAATKLTDIRLHRVHGDPNNDDCLALVKDWDDLRDILMPLIETKINYALAETGADVSDAYAIIYDAFKDAAYAIECKGRELAESAEEGAAESAAEFRLGA
jgi:hypothetical protein